MRFVACYTFVSALVFGWVSGHAAQAASLTAASAMSSLSSSTLTAVPTSAAASALYGSVAKSSGTSTLTPIYSASKSAIPAGALESKLAKKVMRPAPPPLSDTDRSIADIRTLAKDMPAPARQIVELALDEAEKGLCGSAAKSRYHGGEGNWCSEFAVWIVQNGSRDAGVSEYYLGEYLHDTKKPYSCPILLRMTSNDGFTTGDVCNIYGNMARLIDDSQMNADSIEPGDFLAVSGSTGDRSHAAVAVSVSSDKKYIWTVEGNVGNCVVFNRREYMVNGKLDSKIDAVGKNSFSYRSSNGVSYKYDQSCGHTGGLPY